MDKNLELVGATWMTVSPDGYVAFSFIQSGWDEYESYYCSDVQGWEPNQACSATNLVFKSYVLLLACIFVIMFKA